MSEDILSRILFNNLIRFCGPLSRFFFQFVAISRKQKFLWRSLSHFVEGEATFHSVVLTPQKSPAAKIRNTSKIHYISATSQKRRLHRGKPAFAPVEPICATRYKKNWNKTSKNFF